MANEILSPEDQDTYRRIAAWLSAKGVAFVPGDFELTDVGKGPYLSKWDEAKLGPRPTPAEIAATPPAPLPPNPGDELMAALAEVQAGLGGVSTVAGLKTALIDTIKAMRGQGGRAGRIAGRPV